MVQSCELFGGDQFHVQVFGTLGQLPQYALAVSFLIIVLALVGIFLTLGKHHIDQARQLVRSGGHGLRLVHSRAHPAEVSAECRLTAANRRCGQFQCLGGTVGHRIHTA